MLELVTVLVTGIIGVAFIGYFTPKIFIWGSLGMAMFWAMAWVIPAFSPAEVVSTIWPHLLNLLTVYPQAIGLAWTSQTAEAGLLGGLAVILWAVILLPFYLSGIFFGLVTWPELFVFRVMI